MIMDSHQEAISDSSQVGVIRRAAYEMACHLGFDATAAGRVAIVATEMCTNLLKHAQKGNVFLRELTNGENPSLELLAIDSGPGIADVSRSLADGYSTAGSPGTGLGAIRRLSSVFDLYSQSGQGTVVLAQLQNKPKSHVSSPKFTLGVINSPIRGETECGDAWAMREIKGGYRLLLADGLGHGPKAAEASQAATKIFVGNIHRPLHEIVQLIHVGLRPTRGAALAICELNLGLKSIRFAGVGNISGMAFSDSETKTKHFVSSHGTVGQGSIRVQEFDFAWDPRRLVLLYSDGLQTRWSFDKYPGLQAKHPSVIAGVLFRDFQRGSDDTTVLVGVER